MLWRFSSNANLPSQEQSTVLAQIRRAWQSFTQSILSGDSSTTLIATGLGRTMAVKSINGVEVQPKSSVKLDVLVVGAGISGLATAISSALSGHNVTVFESAKELLEVCCSGLRSKLVHSHTQAHARVRLSLFRLAPVFKLHPTAPRSSRNGVLKTSCGKQRLSQHR